MRKNYINCLIELQNFRRELQTGKNIKKGRLYFKWIKDKTQKIENETKDDYIYENLAKYTVKNYKIDTYTYERLNKKLKTIIENNYTLIDNNYIFNSEKILKDELLLIAKNIFFKRGNVVWVDFGFNIGNEFGGMHPAIILKNFDTELFVLPLSSKKPKEYQAIEQEYINKKITYQDSIDKKKNIIEIVQIDNIYHFKTMTRWANITRMKKVSILRLNFSGNIGKIDGKYLNTISKKISNFFE